MSLNTSLLACTASLAGLSALFGHVAHVVELPKLLQIGVPEEELTATTGEVFVYRLSVPIGAKNLRFNTRNGTGDCDLFIRFGAQPDELDNDGASTDFANREHLAVAAPRVGVWYVRLLAARSFSGVTLTATYERTAESAVVPRLLPGPGIYAGHAKVQIKSGLLGGIVHYTTDGTPPTAASPTYTQPLVLIEDTELRVQTYDGTTARGPVLVAPYFVTATGTVTTLQNGQAADHLAGLVGSEALFKITVPAGMARLNILTRGGPGSVSILVRQDEPPSVGVRDFKQLGLGNRTDLSIPDPAAGDWFILLRARTNFSGCTLQASYRSAKPDLVVWPATLQPYEMTQTFRADDCEVQEGMVKAGTRHLLRFTTESRNIGGSDLKLGAPEGNPNFEYAECHGHYHFLGFAAYTLRTKSGAVAATGRKVSFCLEDVARWDPGSRRNYRFDCGKQGIQAGWSDIYDSGLPGQWIDITRVPAGDYDLEVTIDPDRLLEEGDDTNNTAIVPVTITGQ